MPRRRKSPRGIKPGPSLEEHMNQIDWANYQPPGTRSSKIVASYGRQEKAARGDFDNESPIDMPLEDLEALGREQQQKRTR